MADRDANADPRTLAASLLTTILEPGGPPLQDAFDDAMQSVALEPRDRAFVRNLVTTTLRHLRTIDRALAAHWKKSPKDACGKNAIRIGAVQRLYLNTPVHAAVYETVALLKRERPSLASLANAVLRKLDMPSDHETIPHAPEWLIKSWRGRFGQQKADTIDKAHANEPPLDLTIAPNQEEWSQNLGGEPIADHTVRLNGAGAPKELDGFEEGRFWVQDVAASLAAKILKPQPGEQILDMCAAPGGKTAQLCAAGAHVTAIEKDRMRAKRLESNLERLRLNAVIEIVDALKYKPQQRFDAILLDAPCSATGTIRRHPDILWRRRPSDIEANVKLQKQLLTHAESLLKPGGRILYAVCSLQAEEGPNLVKQHIKSPDATLSPLAIEPTCDHQLIEEGMKLTRQNWQCQTIPAMLQDQGGMDGFFMALMLKNPESPRQNP